MEEANIERKLLLAVAFEEAEDGTANYIVDIPKGSTVTETAFCVNVVIRCLIKDKIIEKPSDFLDYVTKYLNEPQYGETK
jgi:hypothetical protein